jgi:hypothetical protein
MANARAAMALASALAGWTTTAGAQERASSGPVSQAIAELPQPPVGRTPDLEGTRQGSRPQTPGLAADRRDALIRALLVIASGGGHRPFPALPQE